MKKKLLPILLLTLLVSACAPVTPSSELPSSEISSETPVSSEEVSSETPSSSEEHSSEETSSEEPSIPSSESSSEEHSSSSLPSEEPSSESSSEPSPEPSSEPSSSQEKEPYTGYYESINPNATGNKLLAQVRELIVTTHTKFASYGDSRGGSSGRSDETDYDPNNKKNLIMFYTQASINGNWDQGKTYNREHVWPQSQSNGLWGQTYGGADMHHIRPAFSSINTARGNKKFGEVSGGTIKTYSYGGKTYTAGTYNSAWEPTDAVKGDVARIVLYIFVRYNTIANLNKNNLNSSGLNCFTEGKGVGDLPITNVMAGNKTTAFETLLEWNELDPVDQLELNRNNGVYNIQGNRNPFIDHPEFVTNIWG